MKSRGTCDPAGFSQGNAMENEDTQDEEVDALCKECGHAFKAYVDRLLLNKDQTAEERNLECPVCGCSDCKIGQ